MIKTKALFRIYFIIVTVILIFEFAVFWRYHYHRLKVVLTITIIVKWYYYHRIIKVIRIVIKGCYYCKTAQNIHLITFLMIKLTASVSISPLHYKPPTHNIYCVISLSIVYSSFETFQGHIVVSDFFLIWLRCFTIRLLLKHKSYS